MLTITIAWDNNLSWSWENAINALQETLRNVSANQMVSFKLEQNLDTISKVLFGVVLPSKWSFNSMLVLIRVFITPIIEMKL